MIKQQLANIIKYNKSIYFLYKIIFSSALNILKFFVKTDEKLILFNSFAGRKFNDSPKAIYEAMKKDDRYKGCRLVWAFHEPSKYDIYDSVKMDSCSYFITALKARVWITNSSTERGLTFKGRRTFYFNTWHGTPLKLMGSDIKKENQSFKLAPYEVDTFCVQSMYEEEIYKRAFHISKDKFLRVGLPRNEILYSYNLGQRHNIRKKLNIQSDKKVILYCPTFREYEKDKRWNCIANPPIDLKKWEKELSDKFCILFRAHYEVAKVLNLEENDFLKDMTNYFSLEELMIASDILISDYSSIFFDYSLMDKVMICFAYDFDIYFEQRGMYFDIRNYVTTANTEDVLIDILKTIDDRAEQKKTKAFREKFINYYGNTTQKCVDYIAGQIGI